ncbi:MAG: Flp pilus assembly protein CpaB [Alphaproteobacteria bacterium]|nr:Flp pilus assembly protein CpaB [Alphaproteobacteria bacterium]
MRARSLILILVAVLLAGGTAMLARAWLAAQKSEPAEASPLALPPPAKSVLVARAPLQRGQILKPEDLAWQPWPEGGIDKAYIQLGTRTPESFAGWVARNPLTAGEPITEAKVVAPGNRGFLAAVLRPGMRAISVPITATSGISGFVFPGDQVDILITHPIPGNTSQNSQGAGPGPTVEHKAAETVLHDVRVIGIDQKLDSKTGEAVAVGHTATLEVTPKQSEVIALATEIGKLTLSLRSLVPDPGEPGAPAIQTASDSTGGSDPTTYTLDSEVSRLLPKPFAGQVNPNLGMVTILRGSQKTDEATASQPASRGS